MDRLDIFIIKALNNKINTPNEYHKAILTALERKEKNIKTNIAQKMIAIFTSMMFATGMVFAGYTVYEKIWERPQQYNIAEEKPPVVTEKEKKEMISEDEIKQKAYEILAKIGYKNKEIVKIDLNRSYVDSSNAYYSLFTEKEYVNNGKNIGININLNAETGRFEYFLNNEFYKDFGNKLESISQSEVTELAQSFMNNIGYNLNGYEIEFCNKTENYNEWVLSFVKVHNGIKNQNENYRISLGKINGDIMAHCISIKENNTFENNEFKISEQEAIEIAKNKEQEFSNEVILKAEAKKSIEKMNVFIYCLENNIKNQNSIATKDRIRNVWKVTIIHEEPLREDSNLSNIENYKKYRSKVYFIDATTGEIIGGEQTLHLN